MAPDVTSSARPRRDVPLADHTTLRLGGPAARWVEPDGAAELVDAVRALDADGEPVLLLGGGSNVVVSDTGVPGTTLRVATTGRRVERACDGRVLLTVEAGEDWDEVVAAAVTGDLAGLECLSGIPGQVGAVPVQNVGAYGVEISELLVDVDLYDRRAGVPREHVAPAELALGYRTSALKGNADAIVLRVRLALRAARTGGPIRYPELAAALGLAVGDCAPIEEIRRAVLALRGSKGMVLDAADHDTWSAGSFFTNPVLPDSAVRAIEVRTDVGASMPRYPAATEGHTKLSAAWLISAAGFRRGHPGPGGRVALSGKHSLALTNRGAGSTADLLTLAREVRDGVEGAFGVRLVPEPVLVGCTL